MNVKLSIALVLVGLCLAGCSGGEGAGVELVPVAPVMVEQPVPSERPPQMGFSELDFQEDPGQRLDSGETAVLFLDGQESVPLSLPGDTTLSLDLSDEIQSALLRDANGNAVGPGPLPAGDYRLEIIGRELAFVHFAFGAATTLSVQAEPDGRNLSGIDLTGQTFLSKEFVGVDLSGANLTNVTTLQTNLFDCDLTGSTLDGGVFNFGNFENCRMQNSSAEGAAFNLNGLGRSDLRGSKLDNCSFIQSGCVSTNFSEATLTNCIFREAKLAGADFRGSDLTNSSFLRAEMVGANLLGARIGGCDFNDAFLGNAIWVDGRTLPPGQRGAPPP